MSEPEFRIATCQACRSRDCCSHFRVDVTGRDVMRIARTLQIAPTSFLGFYHAENPKSPTVFRIDHSEQRYVMSLRRLKRPGTKRPCAFLLKLNTGRKVCGLGDLRPASCQMFPATSVPGLEATVVGVYNGPGCWRSWHVGELDVSRDEKRVKKRAEETAEYAEVVAQWNARVEATDEDYQASFDAYVSFIMNTYAGLPDGPPIFSPEF